MIMLSPTVFCLPVGRGEAAWYDDVVGGGEPGPPIAATTAATGGRGVASAHARRRCRRHKFSSLGGHDGLLSLLYFVVTGDYYTSVISSVGGLGRRRKHTTKGNKYLLLVDEDR